MQRRARLGEMLMTMNAVTPEQLATALAFQERNQCRLGKALAAMNLVPEAAVYRALSRQLNVQYVDLRRRMIAPEILARLPKLAMRKYLVIPVALRHDNPRGPLLVATSEPQDLLRNDELRFAAGMEVLPLLAAPSELAEALAFHGICGPRIVDPLELPDYDPSEFVITRGGAEP